MGGLVEGAGPPGRWEVQPGGAGLLATTDVGRRVPAEEDDAVSAVSELEAREWLDEQGARAERAGAGGAPLLLLTPDFMASAGTAYARDRAVLFLRLFLMSFTLAVFPCVTSLVRTTSSGDKPGRRAEELATCRHCADSRQEPDCI